MCINCKFCMCNCLVLMYVYKLQVLYAQLFGFNNNKFMLDVILNSSTKVFNGDFNVQSTISSI